MCSSIRTKARKTNVDTIIARIPNDNQARLHFWTILVYVVKFYTTVLGRLDTLVNRLRRKDLRLQRCKTSKFEQILSKENR